MVRHVVLFRFEEGTEPAAITALAEALGTLPGRVPEIRRFECGPDLGLIDTAWDFALVADFDDASAYRAYSVHPAHVAVVDGYVAPIVAQAVRVQYEV